MSATYPLIVLCGPSGAGKTTVIGALRQLRPEVGVGVTYTTRPVRPGAREDKDMRYVDEPTFAAMATRGEFAEHATFAGYRYGTALAPLREALRHGPVLLNLELEGVKQITEIVPEAVTVFLEPDSFEALERRLRARPDYSPADVERRLARARADWAAAPSFRYRIVNHEGSPERAAEELAATIDGAGRPLTGPR